MGLFKTKQPEGLTQALVERVWDMESRLKHLETILNNQMDELSKRYRRAEQSEKRLEEKRADSPCGDDGLPSNISPAILALKARQGKRDLHRNIR